MVTRTLRYSNSLFSRATRARENSTCYRYYGFRYRIYSNKRPGRLFNLWIFRVGTYLRLELIRGWTLIKLSPFQLQNFRVSFSFNKTKKEQNVNPLLLKGGGAVATPPNFCFFPLTFLHLTLWRPISNLPAYKSKRYKTVVKLFFQGVIPEIRGERGLQQPPLQKGRGWQRKSLFSLGLG